MNEEDTKKRRIAAKKDVVAEAPSKVLKDKEVESAESDDEIITAETNLPEESMDHCFCFALKAYQGAGRPRRSGTGR